MIFRGKVYSNGNHFIATENTKRKEFCKSNQSDLRDLVFNNAFKSAQELELVKFSKNINNINVDLKNYILKIINLEFENFGDNEEYVNLKILGELHNIYLRKKRFNRKIDFHKFGNFWNYFVTLTYDSKLMNEETFVLKIKRTLSNFSDRRGWRFICVFERAPETKRLHIHAIMHIPFGQLPGGTSCKSDYSFKEHKRQHRDENVFFKENFGINDFQRINHDELSRSVIGYMMKYITKSSMTFFYSRHIKDCIDMFIPASAIGLSYFDFVTKFILLDDLNIYNNIMNFSAQSFSNKFYRQIGLKKCN